MVFQCPAAGVTLQAQNHRGGCLKEREAVFHRGRSRAPAEHEKENTLASALLPPSSLLLVTSTG